MAINLERNYLFITVLRYLLKSSLIKFQVNLFTLFCGKVKGDLLRQRLN